MAPRATWKGYLKLSLVSCPVRLYNATSSNSRVSFHLLHKQTHNRIRMVPHDPELGPVEREVDPIYLDSPYYLAPDGAVAEEAFRVIHEAMQREKKVAISRIVLASRERPVALSVRGFPRYDPSASGRGPQPRGLFRGHPCRRDRG